MTHFVKYQLPVILWALLIFLVSSIPSEYLIKTVPFNIDKPVHVFTFFMLGWLGRQALTHQDRYPRLREHSLISSFVFVLAYGILDEIHQIFIPGRQADLFDVLADAVGGLLFVLTVWMRGWRGSGKRARKGLSSSRNSTDAG